MADAAKKQKVAAQTGLYMVVVVAIVVLVNAVSASGGSTRFDTTENDLYTLSEGSKRLVQSMKGTMTVEAYLTRTNLARQNSFVEDLMLLLTSYESNSNGKFKFTLIDPNTEELKERAKEAGLEEIPMGEDSDTDSESQIAQGYMGLVLKYGSEKEVQPLNGSTHGLEFFLSNKIRELRDKVDGITHKIGVITGKDELKLDDPNLVPKQGQGQAPTLKGVISEYFPFYDLVDVNITTDAAVDANLDGLLITQPGADYTDAELKRIDDFVMLGGKALAVFASAANLKVNDAKMAAKLSTHGLEKLLSGYGINIKKDIVYDYGARFELLAMTQGGPVRVPHPGIAIITDDPAFTDDKQLLDTGFAPFFRLQQLVFPFPSELEILKDKQPGAEFRVVARTTPSAVAVADEEQGLRPKRDWQAPSAYEQRIIAASVEGNLKSALGSPDAAEKSKAPSRVFVVGSGLFLTNPFSYAGNGPDLGAQFQMFGPVGGDQELLVFAGFYAQRYLEPTILSLKNTLDWVTGDLDLIATSAKISSNPSLKYTSIDPPTFDPEKDDETTMKKKAEEYRQARKDLQNKISWVLILGMPLAFGGFGLFRWGRRNARRDSYTV